jgi:hypothetical protein
LAVLSWSGYLQRAGDERLLMTKGLISLLNLARAY